MPKDTRGKVTLTPEAYKALEVEAMLMGVSLKDAASRMILKSACPKCKEILGIMARPPKGQRGEETNGIEAQGLNGPITQETSEPTRSEETKGQRAKGPKVPKDKCPKLIDNPVALGQIKEQWAIMPRPSIKAIADAIGYPKSTTAAAIKRMKASGELQEGTPQSKPVDSKQNGQPGELQGAV